MSKLNASSYFNTPNALGGYTISQSLRFNDGDNAYLEFTPSTSGNRKTFSLSLWVKRGDLSGNSQLFFGGGNSGSSSPYETKMGINDDNKLEVIINGNASIGGFYRSTRLLRDTSAWYHIVIAVDMSASGQSNKVKAWVNGESAAGSYNNLGTTNDTNVNTSGQRMRLGIQPHSASYGHDGYIAEAHFLDGTAVSNPDDFAVLESGIWLPKVYEGGSYGTNGFYMPFDDSSDIGADRSGNGNDFTATNLVASDVVLDSPSNSFPTILPDKGGTSQVYSEGNLHANISSNSYAAKSSMFVPMDSGKWYVEALSDATSGSGAGLGTYTTNSMNTLSSISYYFTGNIVLATDMIHYYSGGSIYNAGSSSQSSLTTVGDKDIIGMLIDTDAKTVQFYVNGTASGTAETMANTTDPVAAQLHGHNSRPFMFNFGTDSSFANRKTSGSANATDANGIGDFYYTPPTGAKAICSKNLPEPSIGPLSGEQPADYFDTQLWTGTGSGQSFSNWSFQPDWLWFKHRNGSSDHALFDSVRGVNAGLSSNSTGAENTAANSSQDLVSFDDDGFTTGTPSQYGSLGSNTHTIVTWGWKAGGTAVSNTDGDTTVNVSANKEAGFSIISGTSPSSYVAFTYGHGLDETPEFIIYKERTGTANWQCWHTGLSSASNLIQLNKTTAEQSGSYWNTHTDSLVKVTGSVSTTNSAGFISYVFHSIPGYSKMGSYTGNGSSNGAYVYTGFRPAWVLVKNIDASHSWRLWDNKRAPDNVTSEYLSPDTSGAEGSINIDVDLLSNGFKMRNSNGSINASGNDYIYLAFAEQPFKYSNAR